MVKKILVAGLALTAFWSCATYGPPPPPSFYLEDIPPAVTAELTLDERIAAEEAWTNLRRSRADRAEKLLLTLGPGNPLHWVGRGFVYLLRTDPVSAEDSFKEAARISPEMALPHLGLAQIYEARGEKELLYSQVLEILKADPDNRWARPRFEALREELTGELFNEAVRAREAGETEAAKTSLLKLLFYDPDSADAHYLLGLISHEENDAESAILHYNAFLSRDVGNLERRKIVLGRLAGLFFDKEDFGKSLEIYQKLAEVEPEDQDVVGRIEELKTKLGIFEPPSQYHAIPSFDAITREDLAALIGVKFKGFLGISDMRPKILVDIATSWAQNFIVQVASLEIMRSFDNHTFQPKRIINRAEMAATLVRLIDFLKSQGAPFVPLVEARRIQISDVSEENFYHESITRIVAYQIMDLSPMRMFEPEKTVSGREAVRLLDIVLSLAR
jgi:tetratricopeptide (TPR) repeat protein